MRSQNEAPAEAPQADDIRSTLWGVSGLAKTGIATIIYLTSRPLNIKIFSTQKNKSKIISFVHFVPKIYSKYLTFLPFYKLFQMDQKMNSFILSHLLQIGFQLEVCMYYKYMEYVYKHFFNVFQLLCQR